MTETLNETLNDTVNETVNESLTTGRIDPLIEPAQRSSKPPLNATLRDGDVERLERLRQRREMRADPRLATTQPKQRQRHGSSPATGAKIVTTGLSFTAMLAITAGYGLMERGAASADAPDADALEAGQDGAAPTAPDTGAVLPRFEVRPGVGIGSGVFTAQALPPTTPPTVPPPVTAASVDLAIPAPPPAPRRSTNSGGAKAAPVQSKSNSSSGGS